MIAMTRDDWDEKDDWHDKDDWDEWDDLGWLGVTGLTNMTGIARMSGIRIPRMIGMTKDDWGWLRMTKDDEGWWGWQEMTGMIGMFEKNGMTGITKDD